VVSGGYHIFGDLTDVRTLQNHPSDDGTYWMVVVDGPASGFVPPWGMEVWMICANA
jgi:hypothetical protein